MVYRAYAVECKWKLNYNQTSRERSNGNTSAISEGNTKNTMGRQNFGIFVKTWKLSGSWKEDLVADWKKGKCKGEKGKGKYLTEKDQSTGCAHNMVNMVKIHTQEHTDHNLRLVTICQVITCSRSSFLSFLSDMSQKILTFVLKLFLQLCLLQFLLFLQFKLRPVSYYSKQALYHGATRLECQDVGS